MIVLRIEIDSDETVDVMQGLVESLLAEGDLVGRVTSAERIGVPIKEDSLYLDPLERSKRRLATRARNRRIEKLLKNGHQAVDQNS